MFRKPMTAVAATAGLGLLGAPALGGFNYIVEPFDSMTQIQAFSADGAPEVYEFQFGPSVTQAIGFAGPDVQGDLFAEMASDRMVASLSVTGSNDAYALASVSTRLTVDTDTQVEAAWDFTGVFGEMTYPAVEIRDEHTGDYLVQVWDYSAGSMLVTLEAGVEYRVTVLTDTFAPGEAHASVRIVPAPGVAGVLGLAGACLARRRRP